MSRKNIICLLSGICIVFVVGCIISNQSRFTKSFILISQNSNGELEPVSETNQKISDTVEMHSSDGQELTVYEMSEGECGKTDFRVPIQVLNDETAKKNYEQTGKVEDIANNLSCVSVEVLDEIFIDYIAETRDIGMVVVAEDYLSQEAIDKIVKEYVKTTEDIGILEILDGYMSEEVIKELKDK